ncbi:hypothetical protein CEXT_750231 [Caerostris extrusa]|uniref:Uncharacterized protein n=1 Tax=Caerostris extrusa TaxID=172846 RepID=A0AAV4Y035_CAEEX|nr:hypothetical protein CEXT_750231 [Caerostris extrusa]
MADTYTELYWLYEYYKLILKKELVCMAGTRTELWALNYDTREWNECERDSLESVMVLTSGYVVKLSCCRCSDSDVTCK